MQLTLFPDWTLPNSLPWISFKLKLKTGEFPNKWHPKMLPGYYHLCLHRPHKLPVFDENRLFQVTELPTLVLQLAKSRHKIHWIWRLQLLVVEMLVDIWRSGGRYAGRYQDILQDEVLKFKIFWKKSSFLIFNIKSWSAWWYDKYKQNVWGNSIIQNHYRHHHHHIIMEEIRVWSPAYQPDFSARGEMRWEGRGRPAEIQGLAIDAYMPPYLDIYSILLCIRNIFSDCFGFISIR